MSEAQRSTCRQWHVLLSQFTWLPGLVKPGGRRRRSTIDCFNWRADLREILLQLSAASSCNLHLFYCCGLRDQCPIWLKGGLLLDRVFIYTIKLGVEDWRLPLMRDELSVKFNSALLKWSPSQTPVGLGTSQKLWALIRSFYDLQVQRNWSKNSWATLKPWW